MSDEYQNAVKKLTDYIGDTVDFAKGQLPDVAKEILAYGAQVDHMWMIIWGIMFFVGVLSIIIGSFQDSEGGVFFGFVLFVASIVFMGCCYADLLKIESAPKLYVMDELAIKIKSSQCSK